MARKKTKLELTWIGKDCQPRVEPRILLEDAEKSYHAVRRVVENDIFDNALIYGDNLLALKALEADYTGKIKCIYIDPPYNTGSAIEHYPDGLESSIWLSMMRDRLELLWSLLTGSGFLAVQIDDRQYARLFILMSELFGEDNLKTICVKMSEPTGVKMASVNRNGTLAKLKEYVILAGKSGIKGLKVEKIPKDKWDYEYKTFIHGATEEELNTVKSVLDDENRKDSDILIADQILSKIWTENVNNVYRRETGKKAPAEEWLFENAWRIIRDAALTGGARNLAVERKINLSGEHFAFSIITPRNKMYAILSDFNHETDQPRCKILFADQYLTSHVGDFWSDIKTTGLDNEGGVSFRKGKKPEKLIGRIISMCSDPGDIVLDSFAGSGTTGAVAHKLRRRWVMVELREQAHTHIIPRLKRVIDGHDSSGISPALSWRGGGGFRYYRLAPSMLEKDKWGQWIINRKYNACMLAEAMCKHMGFTYAPDKLHYWMHGYSTESDFLYVTTRSLTYEHLRAISDEVGTKRTLLICCGAFDADEDAFNNLTLRKIPESVLERCEWGKDDYSLSVSKLKPECDKEPSFFDVQEAQP